MSESVCPLCQGHEVEHWHADKRRPYRRCLQCALVFVPAAYHLSADAEKAVYDLHRNSADDAGYRRFLQRALEPLLARVQAPAQGLDFGCGPGPVLAAMLADAGHRVALYDKFYFPDKAVLACQYDFVTATEVLEHVPEPAAILQILSDLLLPGGWLVIMTKRVRNQAAFSRWHCIQDPTHIVFYSDATFEWIAARWCYRLSFCGPDVVLLQKA